MLLQFVSIYNLHFVSIYTSCVFTICVNSHFMRFYTLYQFTLREFYTLCKFTLRAVSRCFNLDCAVVHTLCEAEDVVFILSCLLAILYNKSEIGVIEKIRNRTQIYHAWTESRSPRTYQIKWRLGLRTAAAASSTACHKSCARLWARIQEVKSWSDPTAPVALQGDEPRLITRSWKSASFKLKDLIKGVFFGCNKDLISFQGIRSWS